MVRRVLGALLILTAACAGAGTKFQVHYFYDKNQSELSLNDFRFLSAKRAIAFGTLQEKDRVRPVALVSGDGGANWTIQKMDEVVLSSYFLDENHGWATSGESILQTVDGGQRWKRISKQDGINALHFQDEDRGWAVGAPKAMFSTLNGGKSWIPIAEAQKPSTTAEWTNYQVVDFLDERRGIVIGYSRPPVLRAGQGSSVSAVPARGREKPGVLLTLETADGGQNWSVHAVSAFGRIECLRIHPDGYGLALFQYLDRFSVSSELYQLRFAEDQKSPPGDSRSVWKDADTLLTDVQFTPDGTWYAAGVVRSGSAPGPLVPSEVRVFRSRDLETWEAVPVNYKARAQRVLISVTPSGEVWLACDTGMLLRLD